MSDILPEKQQRYNDLIKAFKEIADEDIEKLIIYFHIEKHISISEIAEVLGCSRQSLYQKYPNLMKTKKEKQA